MSKPSKKISLKKPTFEEDQLITAAAESDPDALPLTDEQMSAMVPIRVLRGRPKLANKKQLVSIRYSPEVIDYFRASGAVTARKDDALAAHQALASVRKDHAACNVCKFLARVALLEIHGYVA